MPPLALAEAWLAQHHGPQQQATALQWLQGHGSQQQIQSALQGLLVNLWAQGWAAGLKAAAGFGISMTVIDRLLQADHIKHLESDWLDEITDTRVKRLAEVLARNPGNLGAAIRGVLGDRHSADMIVRTETARASNAALFAAYRAAGVSLVRWVTTSPDPCQACLTNQAAGPWPLGKPFPSGVIMPPDHPHCECHLEPAED